MPCTRQGDHGCSPILDQVEDTEGPQARPLKLLGQRRPPTPRSKEPERQCRGSRTKGGEEQSPGCLPARALSHWFPAPGTMAASSLASLSLVFPSKSPSTLLLCYCSVELSEMQHPPVLSLPTANLPPPLLPTGSMALRRGSLTRPGSGPWLSVQLCFQHCPPCSPVLPFTAPGCPLFPPARCWGLSGGYPYLSPCLHSGQMFLYPVLSWTIFLCLALELLGVVYSSPHSPIPGPTLCGTCPRLYPAPGRHSAGVLQLGRCQQYVKKTYRNT